MRVYSKAIIGFSLEIQGRNQKVSFYPLSFDFFYSKSFVNSKNERIFAPALREKRCAVYNQIAHIEMRK